MATNTSPIYSGAGDIQGGDLLINAALLDYTGTNANNVVTFTSNGTYGGYIQKIRFKAAGTNIATVARIYINNGQSRVAASVGAVTGTPTGSLLATTAGNLATGSTGANYFAKIVAVDQYGGITAPSLETASISNATAGFTGSLTWTWANVVGAKSYRIYVGPTANVQLSYFTATASPYTQTEAVGTRDSLLVTPTNNYLYGELSLPATTAIATAATVDIEYPMNFALGPGQRVVVGLGANVAAGWYVTGIGGTYAPVP